MQGQHTVPIVPTNISFSIFELISILMAATLETNERTSLQILKTKQEKGTFYD